MDSLTLPKDMTEQEYRDAIIQMEATIAELDKSDAEKTQDIHNLRDRHSPETTNKMEPSTFPKPAADMTEQEARDATVQLEAAILELDEENENMTQRIRELLDEHESRRDELASWNLVSDTDADDVARVAAMIKTMPEQEWEQIRRVSRAVHSIRNSKDQKMKSTIQEAVAKIKALYEEMHAIDPDQTVLSLRRARNLDETEELAAWMKIMNLGKEEMIEDEDEDEDEEQEPGTWKVRQVRQKGKHERGGAARGREKKD